jgi:hypothetical protein
MESVGRSRSRGSTITNILVKRTLKTASKVAVFGVEFTVT